jgi:hypothetical protein
MRKKVNPLLVKIQPCKGFLNRMMRACDSAIFLSYQTRRRLRGAADEIQPPLL